MTNNGIPCRIPKNFKPEKYIIYFQPDYKNLKYTVNAEIDIISLSNNFPYLIMNASETNYTINSLFLTKFDPIADEWVEIGKKNETTNNHIFYYNLNENEKQYIIQDGFYIPIEKEVRENDRLKLVYSVSGNITTNLNNNSLYLTTDDDKERELFDNKELFNKVWTSNFENLENNINKLSTNKMIFNSVLVFLSVPAKFRLTMPSFDEPCYKSIFNFSLELDQYFVDAFKQIKCVTNGSLIHVKLNEQTKKYLFIYGDSPLMSTYLFTFVIGNYDLIETANENKTKIRVFTTLRNHHDGALCINLAQYSIKFYEKFFDIPYFFEKLDFIPVPNSTFRAMEDFGCIVFRKEAMLFSHFQPISEKKFISRTICHEISHMWFGNLVTMEWWDDIWLNEGFARCFEFLSLNEIQPIEHRYWDNYLYYIYQSALNVDGQHDTHPVVREIKCIQDIDNIFDTISYSKGSSVIRMLMYYIGKNNFQKSISNYLKKYKYQNTNTDMLWACFDDVTKLKISDLMNEWVNFSGHPLLSVEIINKEDNKYYFKLTQKSVLKNDETIWKLPVFIKSKNFEICRLVSSKEYEISFEELALNYDEIKNGKNFVVFNNDLRGFYRCKYDDILFNAILNFYKENKNIVPVKKNEDEVNNIVSDHDIFGLLLYEVLSDNFNQIKKILNFIKPIENSHLLLQFTKDIYDSYKSKLFELEGFEEYIKDEEIRNININELKEYESFFGSIIKKDEKKTKNLINKFYINEENKDMYKNQYNDEYDALYLYFLCIINDDEETAKNVFKDDMFKNFEFLNKNYKYTLIEIMFKYIKLYGGKEKQIELFRFIMNDYCNNYYGSSFYIKEFYQKAICYFNNCDISLVEYIFTNLIKQQILIFRTSSYLHGKNNRRKIFDAILNLLIKTYEGNEANKGVYGNICNFVCNSKMLNTLKCFKINDQTSSLDSEILFSTLEGYLIDKFKLNPDDNNIKNDLLVLVSGFSSLYA